MVEFTKPGLEQFFRTYAIMGFAVSKDEQRIALATNLSGSYDIWGLESPNQYPHPLTHVGQVPHGCKFDPQGRWMVCGFDHDGDENTQLYLLPPNGGQLAPLRQAEGRVTT